MKKQRSKPEATPERVQKKRNKTFRKLSINLLITQALLVFAMVPLVWGAIVDPTAQVITASAIAFVLQFMVLMLYVAMRRFVIIVKELRAEVDELRGGKR